MVVVGFCVDGPAREGSGMKGRYGIRPIPGDTLFTKERLTWCLRKVAYFGRRFWLDEDDILSIALETVWKTSLRGVSDKDLSAFAFHNMRRELIDYSRYVFARKRSLLRQESGRDGGDDTMILTLLDAGEPDPLHLVMAADMQRKRRAEYGRACSRCNEAVSVLRRGLCRACYRSYDRTKGV
jgi:hypothetical protein